MGNKKGIEVNYGSSLGTVDYHTFNDLFKNVKMTDGVKDLVEENGAFWLLEAIASHLPKVDDYFGVVTLSYTKEGSYQLVIGDDIPPKRVYASQEIPYSDFPKDGVKLYIQRGGNRWVIMVPKER